MNIKITEQAAQWFEKEFPLNEGESVRFFGKTYGKTEVHDGFSVGLKLDTPADYDILDQVQENGRTYFAAKEDEWFFARYNFEIAYDKERDEPSYHFSEK